MTRRLLDRPETLATLAATECRYEGAFHAAPTQPRTNKGPGAHARLTDLHAVDRGARKRHHDRQERTVRDTRDHQPSRNGEPHQRISADSVAYPAGSRGRLPTGDPSRSASHRLPAQQRSPLARRARAARARATCVPGSTSLTTERCPLGHGGTPPRRPLTAARTRARPRRATRGSRRRVAEPLGRLGVESVELNGSHGSMPRPDRWARQRARDERRRRAHRRGDRRDPRRGEDKSASATDSTRVRST